MAALTKDLITKPPLWRMALELHPSSVDVVLSSPYDEGPLVYRNIKLDEHLSQLEAFEELVYENPLLLSDFSKVEVMIDTPRFTIVPSEIKSDEVRGDIIRTLWPNDSLSIVSIPLQLTNEALVMGVDEGIMSFVNRTFLDVKPTHAIAVLAEYYAPQAATGDGSKFFANLRSDGADVVGFIGGRLAVANSFAAATPEDEAYFVLAAAQSAGLSMEDGQILLIGDMAMRQKVVPIMREFARRVMPAIFPSEAMKLGPDAVKTPFPLLIANMR